jgi:hypothetical protein
MPGVYPVPARAAAPTAHAAEVSDA